MLWSQKPGWIMGRRDFTFVVTHPVHIFRTLISDNPRSAIPRAQRSIQPPFLFESLTFCCCLKCIWRMESRAKAGVGYWFIDWAALSFPIGGHESQYMV